MTAGAATIVLLVAAVVLAPRPRPTALESQSPRSAALPALATIAATIPDPMECGDGGEAERGCPTLRSGGRPCRRRAGEGYRAAQYVRFGTKDQFTRACWKPASGLETFGSGGMDQRRLPRAYAAAGLRAPGWKQGGQAGASGLRTLVRAVNIAANKRTPLRINFSPSIVA